jgi:uncharacterized OB-fold protein
MSLAGNVQRKDWFIRIARRHEMERCKACGDQRHRDEELCPACMTHAESETAERVFAEPAKSLRIWKGELAEPSND